MPRGDANNQTHPASEAAKVLREAAERYWRFAEQTSDPDRYRSLAMEYHERALRIEHGVWEI
jgi:hypothetical protein